MNAIPKVGTAVWILDGWRRSGRVAIQGIVAKSTSANRVKVAVAGDPRVFQRAPRCLYLTEAEALRAHAGSLL